MGAILTKLSPPSLIVNPQAGRKPFYERALENCEKSTFEVDLKEVCNAALWRSSSIRGWYGLCGRELSQAVLENSLDPRVCPIQTAAAAKFSSPSGEWSLFSGPQSRKSDPRTAFLLPPFLYEYVSYSPVIRIHFCPLCVLS